MSDKRTTLFTDDIYTGFPSEYELIGKLVEGGFMETNPNNQLIYLLTPKFSSLLNQDNSQIEIWIDSFEEFTIQIGSDSQDLEVVKSPDGKIILGNLDFAYECLGKLHENIEAECIDEQTMYKYLIRNLDFSNFVAIGKTFIQLEVYIEVPTNFLRELGLILNCSIKYANYWS